MYMYVRKNDVRIKQNLSHDCFYWRFFMSSCKEKIFKFQFCVISNNCRVIQAKCALILLKLAAANYLSMMLIYYIVCFAFLKPLFYVYYYIVSTNLHIAARKLRKKSFNAWQHWRWLERCLYNNHFHKY